MGKILFIRGGAVGDFILTLPAIALAREHLPDAEIEVLGYQPVIDLARAAGLVHRGRTIEYGPLSSFFIPNTLLPPELMDYFKSFSVVVSYLYDPDGFFRGNLERSGVSTLIEGPHKVDESLADQPAAAQLARPLERLALFLEKPYPELSFDAASETAAERFLASTPPDSASRPIQIALHPGSGSPRKNWSLEGWAETAAALDRLFPGQVNYLVSSGEAEDRTVGAFLDLLRGRNLSFHHAAHLPLPALGALLRRCRLFLGHDSGISHLAAACGLPCLLVFGPTDPAVWAPQNPGVRVIRNASGDFAEILADDVAERAATLLRPGVC
ncbi:MAG: glycosyltransferase family 9 protein [Verrucomicrobiae bacterium]|nr:glycosyltransferase family 9 protein [Verrucomicrobiae bacterium]